MVCTPYVAYVRQVQAILTVVEPDRSAWHRDESHAGVGRLGILLRNSWMANDRYYLLRTEQRPPAAIPVCATKSVVEGMTCQRAAVRHLSREYSVFLKRGGRVRLLPIWANQTLAVRWAPATRAIAGRKSPPKQTGISAT